jgi:hypothetical protein
MTMDRYGQFVIAGITLTNGKTVSVRTRKGGWQTCTVKKGMLRVNLSTKTIPKSEVLFIKETE